MIKNFFIFVCLCISVLFISTFAEAQLLIEKSRVDLNVRPGEVIVDSMIVHNRSEMPIRAKIYWQDFEYLPPYSGKKEFFPAGTSKYSMNDWVTFSPQEIIVGPSSNRQVDFTIRVPEDATGGHYGVLFFEQGDVRKMGATGVNIVTRLGALFFLDSINSNKDLKASDLEYKEGALGGTLSNQGDVCIFPMGQFYIINQEGLVVERGSLKKIYLPPNAETEYMLELPDVAEGVYSLILTFDLDDGDSITREVDFALEANGRIQIRAQRN